jgi:hypothetical protein
VSSASSGGAGPGRPFLLAVVVFFSYGVWLFFGDGVLVICACGLLLVCGLVYSVCEQVVLVVAILVGLLAEGSISDFGLSDGGRPRLGLVSGGGSDVV